MIPDENIKNEFPPNYQDILNVLGDVSYAKPVFAYAPDVYNPFNRDLTSDVLYHESVHIEQQKRIGVEVWYNKYLNDPVFRLEQEIEAYGKQYDWAVGMINAEERSLNSVGRTINYKQGMIDEFLKSLATELSGTAYGSLIKPNKAAKVIKRYGYRGTN